MKPLIEVPREMIETVAALQLPLKAEQRLQFLLNQKRNALLTYEEHKTLSALKELSQRLSAVRAPAIQLLARNPRV